MNENFYKKGVIHGYRMTQTPWHIGLDEKLPRDAKLFYYIHQGTLKELIDLYDE